MTVQDLINQLQTLDPNLPVLIVDGLDRYELHDHQVSEMALHDDFETTEESKIPESEQQDYVVIG
tara:strand:+ start:325 stop:519 length:195 start_codon:yes stop_codon:yes gene_type:complete